MSGTVNDLHTRLGLISPDWVICKILSEDKTRKPNDARPFTCGISRLHGEVYYTTGRPTDNPPSVFLLKKGDFHLKFYTTWLSTLTVGMVFFG